MEVAPFYQRLLTQPKWIQFIGDRGIHSLEVAQTKLKENIQKCTATKGWELFVVYLKESEEPIGVTTFVQRDYLDAPDIGFAFLTEYEGKGYAFEATQATLDHGTSVLGFTRLYAVVSPSNIQSIKLCEKLGFKEKERIHPNQEELILYQN